MTSCLRSSGVQFDGEPEPTTYTREELGYLKLAYAISVHKSQGSEHRPRGAGPSHHPP
ncbi:MAG: hypothetical protein V9H69_18210 [Anaerolineae bacterium]